MLFAQRGDQCFDALDHLQLALGDSQLALFALGYGHRLGLAQRAFDLYLLGHIQISETSFWGIWFCRVRADVPQLRRTDIGWLHLWLACAVVENDAGVIYLFKIFAVLRARTGAAHCCGGLASFLNDAAKLCVGHDVVVVIGKGRVHFRLLLVGALKRDASLLRPTSRRSKRHGFAVEYTGVGDILNRLNGRAQDGSLACRLFSGGPLGRELHLACTCVKSPGWRVSLPAPECEVPKRCAGSAFFTNLHRPMLGRTTSSSCLKRLPQAAHSGWLS